MQAGDRPELGAEDGRGAEMLRGDLAAAKIPYSVPGPDGPLFADFHSLRHTTASHLGKNKVTPRVAQGFLRHSDIRLTLQTYADPRLLEQAEALAALPDLPLQGTVESDREEGLG